MNATSTSTLAQRLQALRVRMDLAAQRAGRDPLSVQLLAVSKTFDADAIREAHALGLTHFAENKAQELREKAAQLADLGDIVWVMIGHLQTNKAKEVARVAHEIQSLDRWELAEALHKRLTLEGRTLRALVQVKTANEESKFGLAPERLHDFVARVQAECPTLQLQGLMTLADHTDDPAVVRGCFAQLARLREGLLGAGFASMTRLSMGMSGDFELAIAEGATDVRVGSALFGARDYA
ncbi:YggS family pyridoxal phosphate enzyme [Comamonas serinivorans]|uniref:Pyridoxal phosphate homeostasis protein n=1 Tax=Comamonas serinivorans TaxID=1082851 RepID=A0A1Y0EL75_9BURK|nr:YggS family pyridoxal phosphate-dependent enzyme [Comamonas serinivorans]ARU04190.1 YggS family pyridoxal phosphate enzyme [Comamonas serinivorans]